MTSIDGFYSAYLTGTATQGFAMFVFRQGAIVGVDVGGVKYDGTYTETDQGFDVTLDLSVPPNTLLVQGVTTGPEGDRTRVKLLLPKDFLLQPYLRIDTKHGPVNAKIIRLRELNDE